MILPERPLRAQPGLHRALSESHEGSKALENFTSKATLPGLSHWGSMYPPNVCLCGLNSAVILPRSCIFQLWGCSFSLMKFYGMSGILTSPEQDSGGGVTCKATQSECPQTWLALDRVAHHRWFNPNPSGPRAPFPVAQLMSPSLGLSALVFPTCPHILEP